MPHSNLGCHIETSSNKKDAQLGAHADVHSHRLVQEPGSVSLQMTSFTGIRPFYVAGAAFLFLIQLALILLGMPGSLGGRADFRQLYAAGYMLRTGHGNQLYDYRATITYEEQLAGTTGASLPFNHPAYEALLFAGLSYLPYRQAFVVFVFINLLILTVCLRLLSPPADWISSLWSHLPIGLFAGFLPVGICLIQGQDSIIMLGLLTGSFVLAESGRDGPAGVLLALSLFKFQFIVPIVCLSSAPLRVLEAI